MIRRILHWLRCEWGEWVIGNASYGNICYYIYGGKIDLKFDRRTCKICGRQEFK